MGRDPNPERAAALEDWEAAFRTPPPPYLSVAFMQQAVMHHRQCKAQGGLPAKTRRALQRIASGQSVGDVESSSLTPGAHLLREWNGRTYQVSVVDGGFEMDGKTWRSLSAIARHITGAHWSGPRFFGVNSSSGSVS